MLSGNDAMRWNKQRSGLLAMAAMALVAAGCGGTVRGSDDEGTKASGKLPAPEVDMPAAEGDEKRAAVLAGGCFWCVEAVFQQLKGVEEAVSGYAGGKKETARYPMVARGLTDHAESVRVVYDPSRISYGQLLRVFFTTHDPTQLNRQGPDVGRQYRSAIFYANEAQQRVAEAYLQQLAEANAFKKPIETKVVPLEGFYPAEDYHQDYVRKNPDDPYVRQYAPAKLRKVREKFPELVREGE